MGEEIDSISGKIRVVCNSDLHPLDVQTAKAAKIALWKSWTVTQPETLVEGLHVAQAQNRFKRLYDFLSSGKLEVRVLPDEVFGLIHGKSGVITLADGSKTSFMGSANEFKSAWRLNYELVWEDTSLRTRWIGCRKNLMPCGGTRKSYHFQTRSCRILSAFPGGKSCATWIVGPQTQNPLRQ